MFRTDELLCLEPRMNYLNPPFLPLFFLLPTRAGVGWLGEEIGGSLIHPFSVTHHPTPPLPPLLSLFTREREEPMNILFLYDIKTLRLVYVITNKYMSVPEPKATKERVTPSPLQLSRYLPCPPQLFNFMK